MPNPKYFSDIKNQLNSLTPLTSSPTQLIPTDPNSPTSTFDPSNENNQNSIQEEKIHQSFTHKHMSQDSSTHVDNQRSTIRKHPVKELQRKCSQKLLRSFQKENPSVIGCGPDCKHTSSCGDKSVDFALTDQMDYAIPYDAVSERSSAIEMINSVTGISKTKMGGHEDCKMFSEYVDEDIQEKGCAVEKIWKESVITVNEKESSSCSPEVTSESLQTEV